MTEAKWTKKIRRWTFHCRPFHCQPHLMSHNSSREKPFDEILVSLERAI